MKPYLRTPVGGKYPKEKAIGEIRAMLRDAEIALHMRPDAGAEPAIRRLTHVRTALFPCRDRVNEEVTAIGAALRTLRCVAIHGLDTGPVEWGIISGGFDAATNAVSTLSAPAANAALSNLKHKDPP
ncbi:MAG: hypothetical protein KA761_00130 [Gemmatimonadaceae bacterium]|nr:hypothetical protein [Gemmatimonadaceae bacterium]